MEEGRQEEMPIVEASNVLNLAAQSLSTVLGSQGELLENRMVHGRDVCLLLLWLTSSVIQH